jgi:hypothetical protein
MITIPIYIRDYEAVTKRDEEKERLSNLGLRSDDNEVPYQLVDFHFREEFLSGFWIDPDNYCDRKINDIVFYVTGESFRTSFTSEKVIKFMEILTNNK